MHVNHTATRMPPAMTPQTNNLTKKQRRLTYAIICIISLLGGVEYGKGICLIRSEIYQYQHRPMCIFIDFYRVL